MSTKLYLDGNTFKNEEEYRRYRGLRELVKEGQIEKLEVNPEYPIMIDDEIITVYIPTFCFFNVLKKQEQVIQVMGKSNNPCLELKLRLFEAIYKLLVERW